MLVALLLLPGCATTSSIRGKLRLLALRAPPYASRIHVPKDRITDAVVYVARLPARQKGARRAPAERPARTERATKVAPPTVVQRAHRFYPHVLTVTAGTTVRFENRDRIYHKIFSVSRAKRFNTRVCAPRKSREVTFNKPGVVRVFCEVDRRMDGFVFVVPNALYTRPDSTGAFELPDLPPGRYQVAAWHPTRGKVSRKVDVGPRDVALNLRF